jgi:hypothetical protein
MIFKRAAQKIIKKETFDLKQKQHYFKKAKGKN